MIFAAKVTAFQARRAVHDLHNGPRRLVHADGERPPVVIAESRTMLWPLDHAGERAHQLGKTHNLRRSARALDRLVLPAGETFSFWKQLGRATAARGFAVGRMLQEGCMVPAVGGGLCQLSNALYDVALKAGCTIIERHGHSQVIPGSAAAAGRDATVAWNYVDLRFAAPRDVELEVSLTKDLLVVRLLAAAEAATGHADADAASAVTARRRRAANAPPRGLVSLAEANSCASCNETGCFLHEGRRGAAVVRTAYVVDEAWPELRGHVAAARTAEDVLARPTFAGAAGRAWSTDGFGRAVAAPLTAARRSWMMRRLAQQGAARRRAELDSSRRIAEALGTKLGPEVETVVVAQSLLPFLWRAGHLGGRPFEVLMTRWPMAALQARLDAAYRRHPERATLADFRAPAWLITAEAEALAAAERVITPHAGIAALFGRRAVKLDWAGPKAPALTAPVDPRRVAFPGPTAARKGAHEVRAAALALGLQVVLSGSQLEGPGFWDGVDTVTPENCWLDGAACVVLPAVIEDQPRKLLQALAAGVPVIATEACGIDPRPGLTLIPEGDADALIAAIQAVTSPVREVA